MDLSERIRARLRDEFAHKKMSQTVIAKHLTKLGFEGWNQVRVGRVLSGFNELKVDDAAALAGLVGLSMVDLVREPGREFVADLTPGEMQALTVIREHPDFARDLMTMVKNLRGTPPRPSHRTIKERMRRDR